MSKPSPATLFLFVLNVDEAQGEKSKESIRAKCVQYLERAEKLKICIIKKKESVTRSGGRV